MPGIDYKICFCMSAKNRILTDNKDHSLLYIINDDDNRLSILLNRFSFRSSRIFRAADWNLEAPDWNGRLRLVAKGTECVLKLEDKASGELFAKCPIEQYPGISIESVSDSSRYFVLRIQDDSGRAAFIGVGFADRSDSFDLNVALQDHFKWLKQTQDIANEGTAEDGGAKPRLDLSFKEGETIKINMKIGVNFYLKKIIEINQRLRSVEKIHIINFQIVKYLN